VALSNDLVYSIAGTFSLVSTGNPKLTSSTSPKYVCEGQKAFSPASKLVERSS
jgi:hypothetical protein